MLHADFLLPERPKVHDQLHWSMKRPLPNKKERAQAVPRGGKFWKCSRCEISCAFQELGASSRAEARNARTYSESVSGVFQADSTSGSLHRLPEHFCLKPRRALPTLSHVHLVIHLVTQKGLNLKYKALRALNLRPQISPCTLILERKAL